MALPKTVLFFNPFPDFTAYWDKEPYTVKQGKKVYMQDWLAEHIRKHLIDRELNTLGLPTNFESSDPGNPNFNNARSKLEARCILKEGGEVEFTSPLAQEVSLLNQPEDPTHANQAASNSLVPRPWCDSCDSKGMRHKKVCPKNPKKVVSPSDEFAELNQMAP